MLAGFLRLCVFSALHVSGYISHRETILSYEYLHWILALKCKHWVCCCLKSVVQLDIFRRRRVVPVGIGKAIPWLCVGLMRWFVMCVRRGGKKLMSKKNKKKNNPWYKQYRIDLPQWMSRFLLEVNGKFQFNSLIHC